MTSISEMGRVGRVIARLHHYRSWCGETHIQKTAYVAKATRGVRFESDFVLYKHGPFSFDLNNALMHMRVQHLVTVTPQGGYGSTFGLNPRIWPAIEAVTQNVVQQEERNIDLVCSHFAQKRVADLERIATAVFVQQNFSDLSQIKMEEKLCQLKPHIPRGAAAAAFDEARIFYQ